jgi:uroporphyrin-III C-methyltransferase/precorrin-2 dehydrogenase/sirohydrochlorin ferrochelatase
MDSFPIFMRLQGRDVLVVGTGQMADAKRRLLTAAGAKVTVAAELPASLAGYALVFGANGADTTDRAVSEAARLRGVPVNVVDRPELSDFIMPAIVDRGDVVIGISTNGASPILAQRVRGWVEDALPARLQHLAAFARRFRLSVQTRIPENGARRRFWARFFEGEGADLVLADREHRAARAMIRDLNGRAAEQPSRGAIQEFRIVSDNTDDLTLGMLRALRDADMVAHDAALPAAILDYARRDARQVVLGETPDDFSHERARGLRVVVLRSNLAAKRVEGAA